MPLSVYLAASFARRAEIHTHATAMRRDGIQVVSSWHSSPHDITPESELTYAQRAALAERDRDELEWANVVVVYGDPPGTYAGSGGKFFEFGYAVALGTRVVLVGHRESVYGCLPGIVFAETPDAARIYVAGLTLGSNGELAA